MGAWTDQIFQAAAANGGIVRRARADVDQYSSIDEIIDEANQRGFHVIETGGQVVILCHPGRLVIHC